ncbi:MAG: TetR family transcriptional regulator [Solirubrobacteraceae bacterium]|nr:TetR family transcriptional regulator [Solirubrobacteraceae bacterium]
MTTGMSRMGDASSTTAARPAPHEPDAPLGLRERKKQQTRELIVSVALELFDRQGFAATTIPEIARAADVSPRTVSSYFPAKEDLAFPDADATFDRLEARLAMRERGETTAEALRDWIRTEMPRWERFEDRGRLQRRVHTANPELEAYGRRYMLRADGLIARAVAADLDVSPDDLVARMASSATLAIFHVMNVHGKAEDEAVAAGEREAGSAADALAVLDQALLFVSAGIRALQIARAED